MSPRRERQVVVLNAGSATIKGGLFTVGASTCERMCRVSRTISSQSELEDAFQDVLDYLEPRSVRVEAIGHRIVHGGTRYCAPVIIDAHVEKELDELSELAPLHNPVALGGVRAARERFPNSSQVGVFDTAFHAHRSAESHCYALPQEICERYGLRRYGFHGIAHAALTQDLARAANIPTNEVNAVVLQLGSGCSACAVERGRSVETSMGFSPMGGLPMATRPGDLDPGVLLALLRAGWDLERIEDMLNHGAGLEGLAGHSSMQDVYWAASTGNRDASAAIAHFVRAVVMTVGAYLTLLGGEGAIVFGGGIGTNADWLRDRVATGLAAWNVELDGDANRVRRRGLISKPGSRPVYVFETDEERMIARAACDLIEGGAMS